MTNPTLLSDLPLRCRFCGAPYSSPQVSEILTCGYCGGSQRIVDARQFLDHFTAQVSAFVRQTLPIGIDLVGAGNIDPVARLSAFSNNVRPRLVAEADRYRFALFHLLASPMVSLPFLPGMPPAQTSDPATVAMFVAQVQSMGSLAVDEQSRDLLRISGGIALAYQSLLVAGNLAGSSRPERFHLIAQNLDVAATAIASTGKWAGLSSRVSALSRLSIAADQVFRGSTGRTLRNDIVDVETRLGSSKERLGSAPDIGYLAAAVGPELAATRILRHMGEILEYSPGVTPPPLLYLERLGSTIEWLSQPALGEWAQRFQSWRLREEVIRAAAELRAAQGGRGEVRALVLPTGTFLPFWVVEIPYTFETGVLWRRQGKEVPEVILLSATFPTDSANLYPHAAARPITNVFQRATASNSGSPGYLDRLTGAEQRLSGGQGISGMVGGVGRVSIRGRAAAPPLSTESEALEMVTRFLTEVRATDPRVANQLRTSSPRVAGLVYIPCELGQTPPIPWLGTLSPVSIGSIPNLVSFTA